MLKNIFQTIKDWFTKASNKSIEFLRPNAKLAYNIVNAIKTAVENPAIDVFVALTKTTADDVLVLQARAILPKIAERLLVVEIILNSNPTNNEIISALIDYLKKQNKDVRAAFYIALAGKINEALADGHITFAEGVGISQIIFEEMKNGK